MMIAGSRFSIGFIITNEEKQVKHQKRIIMQICRFMDFSLTFCALTAIVQRAIKELQKIGFHSVREDGIFRHYRIGR